MITELRCEELLIVGVFLFIMSLGITGIISFYKRGSPELIVPTIAVVLCGLAVLGHIWVTIPWDGETQVPTANGVIIKYTCKSN